MAQSFTSDLLTIDEAAQLTSGANMISMGQPKRDTPQKWQSLSREGGGRRSKLRLSLAYRRSARNFADRPCSACRQAKHANQDRGDVHEPEGRQEPRPYQSIFSPVDHLRVFSATASASRCIRVSRTWSTIDKPPPANGRTPVPAPAAPSRNPMDSRGS